jgi:DNA-binding HxlR family transcriptional regulator
MLYDRSDCPISASLDLIGDKWSLIIIRDLLTGKQKFTEFLHSPEQITTNILTDRLKRLEQAGLITAEAYSERPLRYAYCLTAKGRALHPVLQALCRWGNAHLPGTWTPPESFMQASESQLDT